MRLSTSKKQDESLDELIEIWIGESDPHLALSMIHSLKDEGVDSIRSFISINALRKNINPTYPDLLIIDSDMNNPQRVVSFITDVRVGKIGKNPFIPIIASIWRPNHQTISNMFNAGVDGIIAKPINITQLLAIIKDIVHNRKPFIVSSQYIGPDRRRDVNRSTYVSLMYAPNTLRSKVLSEYEEYKTIKLEVERANIRLNLLRLKRDALYYYFLSSLLCAIEKTQNAKQIDWIILQLYSLTRNFKLRAERSKFLPFSDKIEGLCTIINQIYKARDQLSNDLLTIFKAKTVEFALFFNQERTRPSVDLEIEEAITNYNNPLRHS